MSHDHSPVLEPSSLAQLVPLVRDRLKLDSTFPDEAVLASLQAIAAAASPHERWGAAFHTSLGHWLGLKAADLNAALTLLLGLLAEPTSKLPAIPD